MNSCIGQHTLIFITLARALVRALHHYKERIPDKSVRTRNRHGVNPEFVHLHFCKTLSTMNEDVQKRQRCQSQESSFFAAASYAADIAKHGELQQREVPLDVAICFFAAISPTPHSVQSCSRADAETTRSRLSAILCDAQELGHTALDVAGMIPMIGEAADIANAGWYALEGDYTNAALSAAGAVPFCGNAATVCKISGRVQARIDDVSDDIADAADAISQARPPMSDRSIFSIAAPAVAAGIVLGALGARRYWFTSLRVAARARRMLHTRDSF